MRKSRLSRGQVGQGTHLVRGRDDGTTLRSQPQAVLPALAPGDHKQWNCQEPEPKQHLGSILASYSTSLDLDFLIYKMGILIFSSSVCLGLNEITHINLLVGLTEISFLPFLFQLMISPITQVSKLEISVIFNSSFLLLNHLHQISHQALLLPPQGCFSNLGLPLCPTSTVLTGFSCTVSVSC